MIKNERQYRITRAQAEKFEKALEQFRDQVGSAAHKRMLKIQEEALRSQLETLRSELREYEALKSGDAAAPDISYVENISRDLIQARIAAGLSQRDLAELLGVPEQQIQRYEATDYESASLARIIEVAELIRNADRLVRN